MSDPIEITTVVLDAVARICSEAIGGGKVFAAGLTDAVTDLDPDVVPLADDFAEHIGGDEGAPAVTVTLGAWSAPLLPGHVRETITVECAIWRRRVPLGENIQKLYGDRDRLIRAFAAHTLGFQHVDSVTSVILLGSKGIKAMALPRRGGQEATALFLTLPFRVEVKVQYHLQAQPA